MTIQKLFKASALGLSVLMLAFTFLPAATVNASAKADCSPGFPCFKITPINPTCENPKFSVKVKFVQAVGNMSHSLYLEDWTGGSIVTLDEAIMAEGDVVTFKDKQAFSEGEVRDYAVSIFDPGVGGIEPLDYLPGITMPQCN